MKEKKVASLKIVFEDGSDYSVACEKGLDKDEMAKYIERAFKPESAEPLIKDEKVRKAVRAWAEANDFLDEMEVHSLTAGTRFSIGHYDIEFSGYFIYDLEANKTYTLAELCGEGGKNERV